MIKIKEVALSDNELEIIRDALYYQIKDFILLTSPLERLYAVKLGEIADKVEKLIKI